MKRIVILLTVFLFAVCSKVTAYAVEISAKSAIVIDAASGKILYEKDAHTKRGMASTTKIMTCLLAIETLNLEDIVTVSPFAAGTEGSSIWLEAGEKISVEDLLYGLMLSSGNDAATSLAEFASGSVDAFTVLMNKRAKELKAVNTNFTNPHGLPDSQHYTTAYELSLISREAMKNDLFRKIVSTKNKTISWESSKWDRSLSNHNKLLKMYEHAVGIKTGYTKKDGRCLVSAAENGNMRLITVTLSAPDDWNDHIKLYEYCFNTYSPITVCKQGTSLGLYNPLNNNAEPIELILNNTVSAILTQSDLNSVKKIVKLNITFPVDKSQKIGECDLYYSDFKIGSADIISGNASDIKPALTDIIKQLMKGIALQ